VQEKKVLLIVSGGIAAFKAPDLVRLLKCNGISVRCVLSSGGDKFVTPLTMEVVSGNQVYNDLFSLIEEDEMGHIELSRSADLILVAPASADIIAKMAVGLANDLATALLLATNKPVFIAPSMNVHMWEHAATKANIEILRARGIRFLGPCKGTMACGEYGMGRMSEPAEISTNILNYFEGDLQKPLRGQRALVTSGPTRESIDPVRYITNYSSGKQGHAIASALESFGAETFLVTGPTSEPDPFNVQTVHVESASEMLNACHKALPVDIAVFAAAVSDWRVPNPATKKLKKNTEESKKFEMIKTTDILTSISSIKLNRPRIVVGFAAETNDIIKHGKAKLKAKNCDWIVANNISTEFDVFGSDNNQIHLITKDDVEDWPKMTKVEVAKRLVSRMAEFLSIHIS